jgi:hypothetical protein
MSITKKTRFEVFKRDKFTCQYCGRAAPDVVLQADHIDPKASGGPDDLLNLVTSCFDCNQGKKDRLLSDDSAIAKRKQQLDQLQERREQLEMMMEWHKSLIDLEELTVTELNDLFFRLTGYHLDDTGLDILKRWVKRFGVNEVIEVMKISTSQYLERDTEAGDPTPQSVTKAFDYIPKICASRKRLEEKPYLNDLYYIRGILKNRLSYMDDWKAIQLMEQAVQAGVSVERLRDFAKVARNWSNFKSTIEVWCRGDTSGK